MTDIPGGAGPWHPIEHAPTDVPVIVRGPEMIFSKAPACVPSMTYGEEFYGLGIDRRMYGWHVYAINPATGKSVTIFPTKFMLIPAPAPERAPAKGRDCTLLFNGCSWPQICSQLGRCKNTPAPQNEGKNDE